ncbi:MAG: hypothetical protein ACI4V3_10535 [Faecousia sp.]
MAYYAAPRIYSDWVVLFEALQSKEDDEAVLQAMQCGTLEWQAGVAERFTRKLVEVVNARINAAIDRFQRDMGRSAGQERNIVRALLSLRRELAFLSQTVDLPVIPQKDRQQYRDLVLQQAKKMQESLENSAKRDRSGKLASIVKNNRVDVF